MDYPEAGSILECISQVFVCSEGKDNSHSEKKGSEFVEKPFCQCYDVSIDRSSTCCEVVA